MLRNYIDETYLKALIPNLDRFLFSGNENHSAEKAQAENEVIQRFINNKFKAIYLRPDLTLQESATVITSSYSDSSEEDEYTRRRWCINVSSNTGSNVLTLQGRDEDTDTWSDIQSVTITQTGDSSYLISEMFKFYRINMTIATSINYNSYLTETNYDLLFAYRWAMIIYRNAIKEEGDQFHTKYKIFEQLFENEFQTQIINYDTGSGVTSYSTQSVRMLK